MVFLLTLSLLPFQIKKKTKKKHNLSRASKTNLSKKHVPIDVNCELKNMKGYGKDKRNKKENRPTVNKDNSYQQTDKQTIKQTNKQTKQNKQTKTSIS